MSRGRTVRYSPLTCYFHSHFPAKSINPSHRMKWVGVHGSGSGTASPPCFKFFNIQAMLRPRVRIVCSPSMSWEASPGKRPCTLFQYCDGTTGMLLMVKYLFSRSNVALAPPRRTRLPQRPACRPAATRPNRRVGRARHTTTR